MKQYIDKSAIMTEIKFLRRVNDGSYYYDGWNQALDRLEQFLETIEPVSKEKFIERACDWIKENITNNPNANSVLVRNGCVTLGMLIDDFKKYMER